VLGRKKRTDYKFSFTPVRLTTGNTISKARKAYEREGLTYLLRTGFEMSLGYFLVHYYKTFRSNDTFEFQGTTYKYFFHAYCTTWRNERTVAVPIIWNLVRRFEEQNKEILEVGNVLSYYYKVSHDILDKYEIMDGVINEDVVDFKPSKQYDLIVSIVTLEHVGWSESPRETLKIVRAYENLKSLLSPGGQLILVVALQFNLEFDSLCRSDKIRFSKQYFMRHLKGYEWQEASWKDVSHLKYDHSVPTANAIMIAQLPG
jgi:SAM-dependent methyltransferase